MSPQKQAHTSRKQYKNHIHTILFLRGRCLQQIVGDTGVCFFIFVWFGPDAMLGRRAAAMLAYRPTGSAWQRPILLNVLCSGLLLKLRSFLIVCKRYRAR